MWAIRYRKLYSNKINTKKFNTLNIEIFLVGVCKSKTKKRKILYDWFISVIMINEIKKMILISLLLLKLFYLTL
jgi:hypothetical protein